MRSSGMKIGYFSAYEFRLTGSTVSITASKVDVDSNCFRKL